MLFVPTQIMTNLNQEVENYLKTIDNIKDLITTVYSFPGYGGIPIPLPGNISITDIAKNLTVEGAWFTIEQLSPLGNEKEELYNLKDKKRWVDMMKSAISGGIKAGHNDNQIKFTVDLLDRNYRPDIENPTVDDWIDSLQGIYATDSEYGNIIKSTLRRVI